MTSGKEVTATKKGRSGTKPKKSAINLTTTREYTVHLHKYCRKTTFKKRVPKAVKAIKQFVVKSMKTNDVRIDPTLNKALWAQGIRNPPTRIRIQVARQRNDNEEKGEKYFSFVTHVPVASFKGLSDKIVEAEDS